MNVVGLLISQVTFLCPKNIFPGYGKADTSRHIHMSKTNLIHCRHVSRCVLHQVLHNVYVTSQSNKVEGSKAILTIESVTCYIYTDTERTHPHQVIIKTYLIHCRHVSCSVLHQVLHNVYVTCLSSKVEGCHAILSIECDMLYLYRHRADTSTSGNHQDLPYPLPSRQLLRPSPGTAQRLRDLLVQQGGGKYSQSNNRECDMLYLYRHRTDTSTSGNHLDLPYPLPSRQPLRPSPGTAQRLRDLLVQQGGGEYGQSNNRECDMLYLYRHRTDTCTSGNHQDLPHPLPSRQLLRPSPGTAQRLRDLLVQQGGGVSCDPNNRECDILYLYRHRADTSTSGSHQDLPHPLPSRPPMPPAPAIARRDLAQQRCGGEYCQANNRECDMLYLYRPTSGNHQDLTVSLPSRPLLHPAPDIAQFHLYYSLQGHNVCVDQRNLHTRTQSTQSRQWNNAIVKSFMQI